MEKIYKGEIQRLMPIFQAMAGLFKLKMAIIG